MNWIIELLSALFAAFLGRPTNPVDEGEKAGAAQQQATDLEARNVEVQTTADAGAAVGPVLADPNKLREFEAKDPANRDN